MATGSGKTLIMAGLMLYLYEKGYRNFLFFVNSNNIITKTKDNFLNPQASKYLFADKIVVDGREVLLKEVDNFDEADAGNINIKFTTIQQLHIDLTTTKENSVTLEDFENRKIVLIADEAHHLSAGTRQQSMEGSWEQTVLNVLNANSKSANILLEFTATLDYGSEEIAEKYRDKVIYRYDLAQFRIDKYSKEINLIRSEYDEKQRIIQALILNLYRQELAAENGINLKPVILFKAKRTIKESEENKERFHQLIDDLSAVLVEEIHKTSTVPVVQKAFTWLSEQKLSPAKIAKRIKSNFREENCISANNDVEAELNQLRLNTLEDGDNPIRAVFAVQKLNEGWDVLNLFDIVRLYEGRDGKENKPGKTTMAEAQLIGRGARYFPFALEEGEDEYTRKFDDDVSNDLKSLEELYYHTKEDSKYISELKKALVDTGIMAEGDLVTKQLKLKESFKASDFYLNGRVYFNRRVPADRSKVESLKDLGVSRSNYEHTLSSGTGKMIHAFDGEEDVVDIGSSTKEDKPLSEIPDNIIRFALSQNPFFYFSNLERYLPNLGSISNFIKGKDYLGGLKITLKSYQKKDGDISPDKYLLAVQGLLGTIENEIKGKVSQFGCSHYHDKPISEVFRDKEIKVNANDNRADGQIDLASKAEWYAYDANYGTSEEKSLVELFARWMEHLEKKFTDIYLIRNERVLKIFNHEGDAFEPDFLLFCKQKDGEEFIYQVFIEPKGKHLIKFDAWKEEYLKELEKNPIMKTFMMDKYLITGAPFYNHEKENDFQVALGKTLGVN